MSNCEDAGLDTAAGFAALAFAFAAFAAAALPLSLLALFAFESFEGDETRSFEKTLRSAISVS